MEQQQQQQPLKGLFPLMLLTGFLGGIAGAGVSYLNLQTKVTDTGPLPHVPGTILGSGLSLDNDCPVEVRPKDSDLLEIVVDQSTPNVTLLEFKETVDASYYTVRFFEITGGVVTGKEREVLLPQAPAVPQKFLMIRLVYGIAPDTFGAEWKYSTDPESDWEATGLTVDSALQHRPELGVWTEKVAHNRKNFRVHHRDSILSLDITHHP